VEEIEQKLEIFLITRLNYFYRDCEPKQKLEIRGCLVVLLRVSFESVAQILRCSKKGNIWRELSAKAKQ